LELYFIRHAQSENNAIWSANPYEELRKADPSLTPIGFQQAELVADLLAAPYTRQEMDWDPHNRQGFGLTHLYCGLMERALLTGTIISRKLGLPLVGRLDFHEAGGIYLARVVNGQEEVDILHGHTRDYLDRTFPDLVKPAGIADHGWWRGGMETREEKLLRAKLIVDFLIQAHGGTSDRVGIITHGGIYKSIFRTFFQVAPETLFSVLLNNCSLSRLDVDENGVTLMYQNRVDFLPTELIT